MTPPTPRPKVSRPASQPQRSSTAHRNAAISITLLYTAGMERYRFHADGALYYVTFSLVDWLPIFVSEPACKIIAESLNFCHERKGLRINAYAIMPTHVHAIVFHESFTPAPLEVALTDFRKFTGRQLADFCESHCPPSFREVLRQHASNDRERRVWQPTRHPVQLESEPFWRVKFDYLHENPCRKGLVLKARHWRFSSARYWEGEPENDVILSSVDW
jgi:REP-associated tyrosine transposase